MHINEQVKSEHPSRWARHASRNPCDTFPAVCGLSNLSRTARHQSVTILLAVLASTAANGQQPAPPRQALTPITGKDGLQYSWIPAGKFTMGCSPQDDECDKVEKPAHFVAISRGFYIGQTEVTQEAYRRVTGTNPSDFKGNKLPVDKVQWSEAKRYCQGISGRLPTEAEWEYAARGGKGLRRYGTLADIAWFAENSESRTHEVGQKHPNAYGLYDMLGNVWEWVADGYTPDYYESSDAVDPKGPASHEVITLRGGSWNSSDTGARASSRARNVPGGRLNDIGFRCVLDRPPGAN
jgi:formylglycine-generating enzyme required for sulfatase activity